jgi:hypothetical protein
MRGAWIVVAALVVGGLIPAPARAGVYNTAEPWPLPGTFDQFQGQLSTYRAAAVDVPNRVAAALWTVTGDACPQAPGVPLRLLTPLAGQRLLGPADQSLGLHYCRQVAELEAKDSRGMLSLDERINLGAYYIRLGNYQSAIRVLEAKAQESRHFLLRANLATAYELAGIPERALHYRQLALSSWPAMYPGWDSGQVNFYRKAEQYHLTLLRLREEESRLGAGRGGMRLDPLFPKVRFVGAGGEYEAGGIAPAQWAEIPGDAGAVVMQLLLWLPFDDRLHWLLGELLNAGGDVSAAAAMMKPVVLKQGDPTKWGSGAPPELREHYRILEAAARDIKRYNDALLVHPLDGRRELLFLHLPGEMGVPVGGALLTEAGRVWGMAQIDEREKAILRGSGPAPPPPTAPTQDVAPKSTGWVPDWRQMAVSFAAGVLVAWLVGHQIRQARRPRT